MNSINRTVLEKQRKFKDKKSDFKSKWIIPAAEGFVGSLGSITFALVVTLVAWLIRISKKDRA